MFPKIRRKIIFYVYRVLYISLTIKISFFCHGVCKCNLVSNETFDIHCIWFWDLKNFKKDCRITFQNQQKTYSLLSTWSRLVICLLPSVMSAAWPNLWWTYAFIIQASCTWKIAHLKLAFTSPKLRNQSTVTKRKKWNIFNRSFTATVAPSSSTFRRHFILTKRENNINSFRNLRSVWFVNLC